MLVVIHLSCAFGALAIAIALAKTKEVRAHISIQSSRNALALSDRWVLFLNPNWCPLYYLVAHKTYLVLTRVK